MSSSPSCVNDTCQQMARVLCICCQQNFCLIHFNEHSNLLESQRTSFSNKLKIFSDKMDRYYVFKKKTLAELDKWRDEAHQQIDHFHARKKQQYKEFFKEEQDNHKNEIVRLQNQLKELNEKENLDKINQLFRLFEEQINRFQCIQFLLSPLVIDNQLVTLHQQISTTNDYLPLTDSYQTLNIKTKCFTIATNDNFILVEQDSKLCLLNQHLTMVKEISWSRKTIVDMFWSKTLAQFLIITFENIFALDTNQMTLKQISFDHNKNSKWYCGTCTNDNLFLSTLGIGPSIFKYKLQPLLQFVKEYRSIVSVEGNERIQDLSSNNHILGVLIENDRQSVRFDLYSQKTLERYWSIEFNSLIGLCGSRACSLKNNEWMVVNPSNSELLHISAGGKIIKKDRYNSSPIHAAQMDNHTLVILTEEDIRLYKLS